MSKITTLQELYIDKLKDLWSAQNQMARALRKSVPRRERRQAQRAVQNAQDGIAEHTELLKDLIEATGEEVSKVHCKGMEGLAAEAVKHATGCLQKSATHEGQHLRALLRFAAVLRYHNRTWRLHN